MSYREICFFKPRRLNYLILTLIVFCININFFSQNGENNIWYFGRNAGIDFNTNPPSVLNDGKMNVLEGCSSVSDENGDLLFYTDGRTVWNRLHDTMPNGKELSGFFSSAQSNIIVPQPESNDIYYIFTTNAAGSSTRLGLQYSILDMSLDGGFGNVTGTKNIELMRPGTDKLTATLHANCRDIWVISREPDTNAFYAYLVTPTGLNTSPVISYAGSVISATHSQPQMKVSPNSKHLISAHISLNVELFDFDNSTGIVSNAQVLNTGNFFYGVEFSPSSERVYVTLTEFPQRNIYQYDLTAANIPASGVVIGSSRSSIPIGTMQIAPDNKIYVARLNNDTLSVINDPNNLGMACNFVANGFPLRTGTRSQFGLPQKVLVAQDNPDATINPIDTLCLNNDTISLSAVDSGGTWSGSGIIDTQKGTFSSFIAGVGVHEIIYTIGGQCTDTDTINVTVISTDTATLTYPFTTYCLSASNPLPTIVGSTGGTFSIDNGGVINTITGEVNIIASGEEEYDILYFTNGSCPDTSSFSIKIENEINHVINAVDPVCVDDSIFNLEANNLGIWSGNGVTDSINGSFNPFVAGEGEHEVVNIHLSACGEIRDTLLIRVNQLPDIVYRVDTNALCLFPEALFSFTNENDTSGGIIATTRWDFGDGSPVLEGGNVNHLYTSSGVYDVTINVTSDSFNGSCSNDTTIFSAVEVYANPLADFNMSQSTITSSNPTVSFRDETVSFSPLAFWNWTFEQSTMSNEQNPIISFDATEESYQVTLEVIDINGCTDTTTQLLLVDDLLQIYLPNTFTPNSDEQNDIFFPSISIKELEKYSLSIFDRWGGIVFETEDIKEGWDGRKKGVQVQEGVYVVVVHLKYSNSQNYKKVGHVNLIR